MWGKVRELEGNIQELAGVESLEEAYGWNRGGGRAGTREAEGQGAYKCLPSVWSTSSWRTVYNQPEPDGKPTNIHAHALV